MAKFKNKDIAISKKFVPRFWEGEDGRSVIVKEIRRRVDALIEETGADSLQKQILIQRAVFILLQIETMEIDAARNGVPPDGVFVQLVNSLQGLLKLLGLEKQVSKTIDLKAYVAGAKR